MHATPALPQASKQMRIRGQPPALAPRIMSRTKIYQKIFRLCLGVSGFLSLACHTAQAASSYTLSGSYACSTSVNFGGFFTRQTNTGDGTTAIGSLSILKFTSGSSQISCCGAVQNNVNNFEKNTATISTTIYSGTGFSQLNISYAATDISNIYKFTIGAASSNAISYFAVANSGSTLLFMDAPTSKSPGSGVCYKI